MDTKTGYTRTVVGAFAVVILAFVLATLWANFRALGIEAETRDVATNALPSIERLVAANDALHDLENAAVQYAELARARAPEAGRRAEAVRALDEAWQRVDRELTAYTEIRSFPGERALYLEVPPALRVLAEAQASLVAQVDAAPAPGPTAPGSSGPLRAATEAVQAATAGVSGHLLHLLRFNATHVYESARGIDDLRKRTARTALWLDGGAVIIALAAVLWVLHLYRRHVDLLHAHAALEGRRAGELELFGRRVAHDLMSPLSALTYCLGVFARVEDEAVQGALRRARTCVHRARAMVEGVLEFSRAGGAPSPADRADFESTLADVIEEVRAMDCPPEIATHAVPRCTLACSRGVLVSVLTNLLRNAVKYSEGSVAPRIVVRASVVAGTLRVEIEDSGPGVEPALREAIFEPYVRADGVTQPGLGLGLSTVKRLCSAHGGEVSVFAGEAGGAVFRFTLPLAKPATFELASGAGLVGLVGVAARESVSAQLLPEGLPRDAEQLRRPRAPPA